MRNLGPAIKEVPGWRLAVVGREHVDAAAGSAASDSHSFVADITLDPTSLVDLERRCTSRMSGSWPGSIRMTDASYMLDARRPRRVGPFRTPGADPWGIVGHDGSGADRRGGSA